jgi:FlaA1/EpsC-like NDP-sugar epimerase
MQTISGFWSFVLRVRRLTVVALHIFLIVASNYISFWLRFDGEIPPAESEIWLKMIPWLVVIRGLSFVPFRLYEGLWRYTGIWDLRNIIIAVAVSTSLFFLIVHSAFGIVSYPRSILIIDSLMLISFMGGIRLARRLYQDFITGASGKRLLIYGAGDSGELIARDIRNNTGKYEWRVVGFLDDDKAKRGRRIHGVKVLGTRKDIHSIIQSAKPDEILIAIPGASGAMLRELIRLLEPFKVPIKILPSLNGGQNGSLTFSRVRQISFEDLLDRASVGLELDALGELVRGKTVLVTGAGGSIGSELCRQIARYDPGMLLMLDKSESALYGIDMELGQKLPALNRAAILGDIKHTSSLKELFSLYTPQVLFHAAAYKHVPMIEHYPEEGVLNNVTGTYRLAQLAIESKIERFIFISTDKAVNPTNVMGATKRLCEMYIQALVQDGANGATLFTAVRFGNVLGSNGSVVPLFLQQIDNGGPVTVTHPDVTRYFMTIPEAVQLVLRAAMLSKGGEIFVLEMGEQIKLVNMARHLIRICGLVPEKDVPINFIGLRPGEKLREELVAMDETQEPSSVEKIFVVRSGWNPSLDFLTRKIAELERAAIGGSDSVIRRLRDIVPTFRPTDAKFVEQFSNGSAKVQSTNGSNAEESDKVNAHAR